MGIRKRISAERPVVEVIDEPEIENVYNRRADDNRGVVDPSRPVFPGSIVERVCGSDASADEIGGSVRRMGYFNFEHGRQPAPTDITARDSLALVRVTNNPGWNVENTYRNRVRSPLTGIRGFCVVTCKSGSPKAVGLCANMSCPLWPFRMGKNGLRPRRS